ncbi:MAG: hypothetical protein Q4B54_01165 [Coriobacteriales bacterium]|nr:hypothetical protein [Coriobacteriales bacterium]
MSGCRFGSAREKVACRQERVGLRGPLDLFCAEGGYTSLATAVALLVSVSLVFCVASVEWTLARGADVQEVADAAAMAGENSVAAFYTIVQVLDACVLSLGLTGVMVMGAGLVCAAVPGAQELSSRVMDQGKKILGTRRSFAESATQGIRRLEQGLPALCVLNSAACVQANAIDGVPYAGMAVPFPLESQSDYTSLASDVNADELTDAAEQLQEATKEAEQAKRRADEACERAWRADCVDEPSCLCSRAASLAGMSGAENERAASPETWNFGMPIVRSRSYYAHRVSNDVPEAADIESLTDSLARKAWYAYALEEVNQAWYSELADGLVSVSIPHLARNSDEVRNTYLYTDEVWPCTQEEQGRVLHSTLSCPGAKGSAAGMASVADIESGSCMRCEACRMDVGDLGAVAAISTSARNGYEHYWQIIVEAAQDYQQAKDEQREAEGRMGELAKQGESAFEKVLDQLRVPRPKVCPPGAWGCVGVVRRDGAVVVPSELTSAFLGEATLPAGVAVSAAVLAPDESAEGSNVMEHFLDGLGREEGLSVKGMVGGIAGLWGKLLVAYGAAFEGVDSAAGSFLDSVDGVFGSHVGAWIKGRLTEIVRDAGFEPADMRMRKPVLTHSGNVLGKAGLDGNAFARNVIQSLPHGGSPLEMARSLGLSLWDELGEKSFVVAELQIPGTDISVPLTIDLSSMGA